MLLVFTTPVNAADETLIVGVESFTPPFVMQGANNKLFGFDVEMMVTLCGIMNRTCQFRIMKFADLIPSVQAKRIDVAVSGITITAERASLVNFSMPYLLSNSRFLTRRLSNPPPFSLELLKNKRIGVETGTIFADQITSLGVSNITIKQYPRIPELVEALNSDAVDYIIMESPNALYWEANSSGLFMTVGEPYTYGNGLGIAIQPNDGPLTNAINQALMQYQNSEDFKLNFKRYMSHF